MCPQLLDAPAWVPKALRRKAFDVCLANTFAKMEPYLHRYQALDEAFWDAWYAFL